MTPTIIIPARFASTRYPGKPLAVIAGRSMLQRVVAIAGAVTPSARVVVATDDKRISDHCAAHGIDFIMTPHDCPTGTDRVYAATQALGIADDAIVINLQGDAVLTPPWVISATVAALHDTAVTMATPAVALTPAGLEKFKQEKLVTPSAGTTVVCDKNNNALYFSKQIIPYQRTPTAPVLRHIGLYIYRLQMLARLVNLSQTPLELAEGLEQLRALEHGLPTRVVLVSYVDPRTGHERTHASVDTPEDIARVEAIIAREGELVL